MNKLLIIGAIIFILIAVFVAVMMNKKDVVKPGLTVEEMMEAEEAKLK